MASLTLATILRGPSDPEQTSVSRDGSRLYIANEDVGKASVLEIATGRTLAEFGDQLGAEETKGLEAALARTDAALAGSDTEALRVAVDELTTLSYKMTEKMYETLGGQSSE